MRDRLLSVQKAVGALLLLAALLISLWNESYSPVLETPINAASPTQINPSLDGKKIAVHGPLTSDTKLEDPDYLLPQDLLYLKREVQVFANVQKSRQIPYTVTKTRTVSRRQANGSYTNVTERYTDTEYKTEHYREDDWSSTEPNPLSLKSQTWFAPEARLGVYRIDPYASDLPIYEALTRVRVGDPGVIHCGLQEFPNGRIVSRSIDNRIGAFVALEGLRRAAAAGGLKAGVTAVGTTQEEIAWTGGGARVSAFALEPAAAVVVDVTHATDHPGAEKKEQGDFKLGGGVVLSRGSSVSPVVFDQLVAAAEAERIPYAIEAAPRGTSTDADGIYNVRRGVATALVSVPCRYMHSPNEMVALDDLDRAADLLAAWARRLDAKTSFIPS